MVRLCVASGFCRAGCGPVERISRLERSTAPMTLRPGAIDIRRASAETSGQRWRPHRDAHARLRGKKHNRDCAGASATRAEGQAANCNRHGDCPRAIRLHLGDQSRAHATSTGASTRIRLARPLPALVMPPRLARLTASRRFVFTRSPAFFGISEGATPRHSWLRLLSCL